MIPGIVAGRAIVPPWSPADLATPPAIWLDWNSPVTDSSGAAADWSNSRGTSGGSFSQATALRRPTILTDGSIGRRVLRFNGTSSYLRALNLDTYRAVSSAWLMVAYRKRGIDESAGDRPVALFGNNAAATRVGIFAGRSSPNVPQFGGRRADGNSFASVDAAGPAADEWVVAFGRIDYTARTIELSMMGATPTATTGAFDSAGLTSNTTGAVNTIGADLGATPTFYGDIDIAGVWGGTSLAAGDEDRLVGWCAWEIGLSSELPVDHPYKAAPP